MSISIFQRFYISHIAVKDAKGAYGTSLKSTSVLSGEDTPQLSAFMNQLVIAYAKRSLRKQTRTRSLRKLYINIIKCCDNVDEELKQQQGDESEVQDKLSEIDTKIDELRNVSEVLENAWDEASQTGRLPPGLGVYTVKKMKDLMDQNSKEIARLNGEKAHLTDRLTAIRRKGNTRYRALYDRLTALIVSYRDRIDHLYRNLEAYSNHQDELLAYYWHKLLGRLPKGEKSAAYVQTLNFSQLCEQKDVQVAQKDTVFQNEREEINRRICNYPDFEIEL